MKPSEVLIEASLLAYCELNGIDPATRNDIPMPKKNTYTPVHFGYDDGCARTVLLMIGEWRDGNITLEGHDLDMVTAAFFHLFGYTVEPGLKQFQLRKYKNGVVTHIVDDRMSVYHTDRREKHALSWSLMASDDRPDELRLFVNSTQTKMYMNFSMSKDATAEFGRRLAEAAEWDIAA